MCKFPVLELWKFKYLYFYIFLCLDLELEYYWLWPLSTSTLRYSSRNKARWAAWEPCSSKPRSYREPFSSWSFTILQRTILIVISSFRLQTDVKIQEIRLVKRQSVFDFCVLCQKMRNSVFLCTNSPRSVQCIYNNNIHAM